MGAAELKITDATLNQQLSRFEHVAFRLVPQFVGVLVLLFCYQTTKMCDRSSRSVRHGVLTVIQVKATISVIFHNKARRPRRIMANSNKIIIIM